jgi:hypothetical protein
MKVKIYTYHCLPKEILVEDNEDYRFEIYEKTFLHYGRGSNWDNQSEEYHRNKTLLLEKFVQGCEDGRIKLPEYDYVFDEDCWSK